MNWDEFRVLINEHERLELLVTDNISTMARLVAGRLEKSGVSNVTLRKLKNELRRYNPHTDTWRGA